LLFILPELEPGSIHLFTRPRKSEFFYSKKIDFITTCYFFRSLPLRISRGLLDSTKSLDEFVASPKCVKDHSRT